jgi:hypothetical protein
MDNKPKYDANIHHRRSIRLKGYDYSRGGLYFITICCQYKARLFGEIDVGTEFTSAQMILNKFGQIAYNEWLKTPEIRNNIALGEFVVMPNHIHCIIQILERGEYHSPLHGTSNNIGAIVRGYKSTVTKQLNILNIGCPVWQRNYYEHIIRDELSYQKISNYITNNPEKWANDTYNIK